MLFDMSFFETLVTGLSGLVTAGIGISTWFFRCLVSRFDKVENSVEDHARRDEEMHLANLGRFSEISVVLARLEERLKNG